jgi:hypothetical protein
MAAGTGSRLGVLGGLAGVVIGGFTWVVVYGLHLHAPLIAVSGIAVAAALWLLAAGVYDRFPARRIAVLGALFIAVAGIDWLYIGVLLPRLPELPANPAIGISRASLRLVQPILIGASVAGTALVLWDLLRRKT